VLLISNTTDAARGGWTPTLPEHLSSSSIFSGVCVTRFLVLCVMFCDHCLSFWPLCCLSFFDLWVLVYNLVSSNSPCKHIPPLIGPKTAVVLYFCFTFIILYCSLYNCSLLLSFKDLIKWKEIKHGFVNKILT
jgi:hypothetical protein